MSWQALRSLDGVSEHECLAPAFRWDQDCQADSDAEVNPTETIRAYNPNPIQYEQDRRAQTQKNRKPAITLIFGETKMVGDTGIEPATSCVSCRRSNQLS